MRLRSLLSVVLLAGCFGDKAKDPLTAEVVTEAITTLPVTTADAQPEIAPMQKGDLSPPADGVATDGLRALLVGPQGVQTAPRQGMVVFDRPMVALDQLDAMNAAQPLVCTADEAKLSGRARWAGTTTAVWLPDGGHFPKATAVRCEVPAGTAAVDGTKLKEAVHFGFETERPGVSRTSPGAGSSEVDPSVPLLLVFNQPIGVESVKSKLRIQDPTGHDVKLSVRRALPVLEGADPAREDNIPRVIEREVDQAVLVDAKLDKDTDYTLTVDSGLRAEAGPLGMTDAHSFGFHTISPPGITEVGPKGEDVSPFATIEMNLVTRTDAAELGSKIKISPTPPGGWNPADAYAWGSWSYSVRLAPMTRYTVTVEPGAKDTYGQTYTERKSWTFTTTHLPPLIDTATGPQVYPANNPKSLPIRSRNLGTLNVAFSRVDNDWVLKNLRNWQTFNPSAPAVLTQLQPVYANASDTDKVRIDKVDFSSALTDGKGLVYVEVSSPTAKDYQGKLEISRSLLQVTDLGTNLKLSPTGATVWVTRLSDGAPVEGATVELHLNKQTVWSGLTDKDGLANAPSVIPQGWKTWQDPIWAVVKLGDDVALTSSASPNDLSMWTFNVPMGSILESRHWRTFAFADRGVYKPGDTMHVAFSARLAGADGLTIPEGALVDWKCSDARGLDLGKGHDKLHNSGWGSFDVVVAKEAALGYGDCEIAISSKGERTLFDISVPVYEYRAPEYRVDVSAPDSAIAGDKITASGQGRYLFGAPMANADVKWSARAMEVDPAPRGWDNFSFAAASGRAWWDSHYYPEEAVSSGEGKLGTDGSFKAELSLPITEVPKTRNLTFEYTVTDVARQRISNRGTTLVHPSELYVGLRPLTSLGTAGKELGFELIAVSTEGQAKSGVPITVSAVRRTWDTIRQKDVDGHWRWVSTPKDDVVATQTVSSGDKPVVFNFTPPDGGYYVVKAEVRDSSKRLSRSEDGVYVAGGDVSWSRSDDNQIELVPDKRRYAPGDVAKVLIKAPRPGLTAMITVEREGILDRKVRKLGGAAETVEIPLSDDAVPNLFVSVVLVEGAPPSDSPDAGMPSYYLGYTQLTVDANGRHLAVDVQTDKESYQPGDEVKIAVNVTRTAKAGASPTPVNDATLVLYAVDYGVLSLTGYETPDAFDTYYRAHPLRVMNADNRTTILDRGQLLAKGAEPGGGGGETSKARNKFVTTPLWATELKTDASGTLNYSFKLPDNLTTFQIMAVASQGAQGFGSGDRQVRVSRPLIASPALPRVLRVGDKALAGVVVHNNTDAAASVTVTGSATGVTLKGSPKVVQVPAGGALEVPFALTEPIPGTAAFRFDVSGGGNQDAVEVSLPVLRPIPAETVASAGVVDGTAKETVAALTDVIPGVGGLSVEVSPTVMVGAESSLTYLINYPHGCIEQTTSRLLASVLAKELGDRLETGRTPAQLDEYIGVGLSRIEGFRHASGGLAYWSGARDPSALGTAAALEAMVRAGKTPDADMVRFLREFLSGKWVPDYWDARTRLITQARVALTLARVGQGDAGYNTNFYQSRDQLNLTGQAELLEAIARTTGADSRTKTIITELGGAIYVEADAARLRDQDDWSALWDGESSSTAAFLSALISAQPDNPLLPRLARGLVDARQDGFWGNTYTTLRSFRALADYAARFETGAMPTGVHATLAGKDLFTATFDGPKSKTSFTGLDSLAAGDLVLTSDGGRVYYESRLSYAKESMPPRDEGFTLTRSYAIMEGTGDNGQVTPGALVQVSLRIVTPVDRYNVAVVDPMPAGLESINTAFKTEATGLTDEEQGSPDTGYNEYGGYDDDGEEDLPSWSSWIFNHRELRDDRVVLYADYMPAGIHTYQYLARATTPGDYARPAATVEEMYKPEHFGRTDAGRFVVGASNTVAKTP